MTTTKRVTFFYTSQKQFNYIINNNLISFRKYSFKKARVLLCLFQRTPLGEYKILQELGFRRPSAAKTLAGSWGGDQSGRINSSHSVIQEFARSDWMRLSGGDQSERINSSHSVIQEFARFKGLFIYSVIQFGGLGRPPHPPPPVIL